VAREIPPVDAADAIAARLRGEPAVLGRGFMDCARQHGVHLLLARHLTAGERVDGLDDEIPAAAIVDRWRSRCAAAAVDTLASACIPSLLIKGAALAETHYAAPYERPRTDLDMLIAADAVDRADAALSGAGWVRAVEPPTSIGNAQRHYQRHEGRLTEQLDLHWRIANAQVFARALPFAELYDRSRPLPSLGPHARAPRDADALVIACLHRVAHHFDADRLLWLWDIHVLVSGLDADERAACADVARRSQLRTVCMRGLERASLRFGTGAADLLSALAADGGAAAEPSARFLDRADRTVDVFASDFVHAGGWMRRSRLLKEHLFPPRSYMGARYPGWPAALLPLAYAYRIARGAPSWFRR
jgi:Uncharacterised nucleotidyltransferase